MHRRAKAADDQPAWSGPPRLADRACCCPARPVVRVLIPPASARPHSVDLLLCGHHYLVSRAALAAVGAVVIDETGTVLEAAPASIETGGAADVDSALRR
jgi:hypothetical protein